MNAMRHFIPVLLLLALAACGGEQEQPAPAVSAPTDVSRALGGEVDPGFARATEPRAFSFPADHGPHPAYRNEWWYVTGNLSDDAGQRYGFQVTFFRIGLAPGRAERPSRWGTHQAWMAHFAVTDAQGGQFHDFERFARGGDIELAGATGDPVQVWLEDWRLERRDDGRWHLAASAEGVALDLALAPQKAPVLNGDRGLSRKSGQPGNASYYYSLTRIAAGGTLSLDRTKHSVNGSAWMDREWSTSALGPDQSGWDWFALQLDDGTDLMLYHLRRNDGGKDRWSAGTLVRPDGRRRHLGYDDFRIEVLDRWTSPRGGTYPAEWRINVDGLDRTLQVEPILADQELDARVRYWEGAVDVFSDGRPHGRGYAELTGYAERPPGNAAND